ncbi:MAG: FKBP-type peptidyl-prolyl cis-trans isomerase [Prevotellaceae bacterium]|jgi:FKBP-type peptidyl-prolyl cis-trans isomerase|nr:FKBP-type peptidyl-prolyl cis-trans isomerase [Prevotellaceae bacterium]
MRTLKISLFALALVFTAESCAQKKAPEGMTSAQVDSLGYAFGMFFGTQLKQADLTMLDVKEVVKGINDLVDKKTPRFDKNEVMRIERTYAMRAQEVMQQQQQLRAIGDTLAAAELKLGCSDSEIDSLSYAIGTDVANAIEMWRLEFIPMGEFAKALNDKFSGKTPKFEAAQADRLIQAHWKWLQDAKAEEKQERASQNRYAEKQFLEENRTKEGVIELENGLQYKIVREGSGIKPTDVDTVEVHYEGRLLNGTIFDSSYKRNSPAKFPLKGVIQGWQEGMKQVGEGTEFELYIPHKLAYDDRENGDITSCSMLIFKVELLKVFPANNVQK